MNPETIASILTAIAGVVGGGMSIAFEMMARFLRNKKQQEKEDIAAKIKGISDSLSKSAGELVDLQEQLKERIAFVEDLSAQAKKAEDIASLNKDQLDAVSEILNANLKKEGKRSFWQGVLVNFIFFILGAVASYIVAVYLI